MPKKSTKKDIIYLEHILKSIEKIERYIKDINYKKFLNDEKLTDALARQLGIIGEATNNFTQSFRKKHPNIEYRKIIAMRNFLIHEYFNVERKIVWNTCKNNIPKLKEILIKIKKT
ncbi:MAG: DUF86 domain-containing protein [Candidatus Moranbacteria bacterium]|nr:DUF86 domain-containing protein [Candidatus Moranbacteria bacterium]